MLRSTQGRSCRRPLELITELVYAAYLRNECDLVAVLQRHESATLRIRVVEGSIRI